MGDDLEVFVVTDGKAPQTLLSLDQQDGQRLFQGRLRLGPRLPEWLAVLAVGPIPPATSCTVGIKVKHEHVVGSFDHTTKALCASVIWTKEDVKHWDSLTDSQRLAKVSVKVTSALTPNQSTSKKRKAGETVQNLQATTPCSKNDEGKDSSKVKKEIKFNDTDKKKKSQSSKRTRATSSSSDAKKTRSKKNNSAAEPTSLTLLTKRSSSSSTQASPRWGHTLTLLDDHTAIVIGGQGMQSELVKDSVWMVDLASNTWTPQEGDKNLIRMGHTTVFDDSTSNLYIFGGAKYKRVFNDIVCYDDKEKKWSVVEVKSGKAPTLSYCSCTLRRQELYIFGGVSPNPDPIPDSCSNTLYIFDLVAQNWYTPEISGDIPQPRSGHSTTLVGDRLILIGGWDAPDCFNDAYALDVGLLEFTKLKVTGDIPSPRSWHTAVHVNWKQCDYIIIHGGFDGETALNDAYILNLATFKWTEVPEITGSFEHPRAGHTATVLGSEIVSFGGGDNDDRYFNSIVKVPIENVMAALTNTNV